MNVTVLSLSQDVSFQDGGVTNFVLLRTPSGHTFRAVITDESAKQLVEERIGQQLGSPLPPASPAPRPMPSQHLPLDEGGAVVFGGDAVEEEEGTHEVWLPSESPEPQADRPVVAPQVWMDPEGQAKAYRESQKQQAALNKRGGTLNAKTVPKDAMGYPVVQGQGVDPGEVVGQGGSLDEDGVGQG